MILLPIKTFLNITITKARMDIFSILWFVLVLGIAFLASILGVTLGGASLIMVPVLVTLGMNTHQSIATVSFALIFLSFTGALTYLRHIKINLRLVVPLIITTLIGAFAGSKIALAIQEATLKRLIAILLIFMAMISFYNKEDIRRQDHRPKRFIWVSAVTSFFVGIYWGFIGGDGALVLVLLLMLLYTFNYLEAIAITRIIGLFAAITASAVFAYKDAIIFPVALPLAVVMSLGAYMGARFIMKNRKRWVWTKYTNYIFAAVTIVLAIHMLMV